MAHKKVTGSDELSNKLNKIEQMVIKIYEISEDTNWGYSPAAMHFAFTSVGFAILILGIVELSNYIKVGFLPSIVILILGIFIIVVSRRLANRITSWP